MPAVTSARFATMTSDSSGAWTIVCGTNRTGNAVAAMPAPTRPRYEPTTY
ncbi:MAG: hypothetical protein QOI82_1036 [Actinomycetota bacterium]|nr:hypothetical protein [Actinomycetota bacterium]